MRKFGKIILLTPEMLKNRGISSIIYTENICLSLARKVSGPFERTFMEEISYLDNASTTRVCPEAVAAAVEAMERGYGNPSSLHGMGAQAARTMAEAREKVAALLGCESESVCFTSGGSEANNMAVFGAAGVRRERHAVVTAAEHSSVAGAMKRLGEQGWEITAVAPEAGGTLDPEKMLAALRPDTALISMMLVNNETGAVFPVEEIARRAKAIAPRALIHCDGVQALGKLPLKAARMGVDLMSVSSHKICGPKGAGALYIRRGARIAPLIYGGGQEKGLRAGTEDLPMIAGFGAACGRLAGCVPKNYDRALALWKLLREELAGISQARILSPENGSPYIMNFSVPGYRGETMLHFLESRGVFVSSGSACSKGAASPVLTAMGLPKKIVEGALRVSLIYDTEERDIRRLAGALREGIEKVAH